MYLEKKRLTGSRCHFGVVSGVSSKSDALDVDPDLKYKSTVLQKRVINKRANVVDVIQHAPKAGSNALTSITVFPNAGSVMETTTVETCPINRTVAEIGCNSVVIGSTYRLYTVTY